MKFLVAVMMFAACSDDAKPGAHDLVKPCEGSGVSYPDGCEAACLQGLPYEHVSCEASTAGGCNETFEYEGTRGCCQRAFTDPAYPFGDDRILFFECQ